MTRDSGHEIGARASAGTGTIALHEVSSTGDVDSAAPFSFRAHADTSVDPDSARPMMPCRERERGAGSTAIDLARSLPADGDARWRRRHQRPVEQSRRRRCPPIGWM